MSMSNGDKVLQTYIKQFGQIPDQPNQLVSFSRTSGELPPIIYSEAKKALNKIKKSITNPKQPKWMIGDEVLISKDRIGILKYIGRVPETGDDKSIFYGIELASGTLGQNDGMLKGKRYFQAKGKRGMFIPEHKLRRRLSRKDKERRNSYSQLSRQVKQLQKEYAGDDAAYIYPSSQIDGDDDVIDNAENQSPNQYQNQRRNSTESPRGGDSPQIS
eukprot:222128_1